MPEFSTFLDYLKFEKRFSVHTVNAYELDLKQFSAFLKEDFSIDDDKEITHHHIRSWLVALKGLKSSHKTIHRKVSSVKSYFKYKNNIGSLSHNPTVGVKLPKIEKRIPQFIKTSELNQLQSKLSEVKDSFEDQRDDAIVLLLLATGIRRAELINLKSTDFHSNTIKVLGKRKKERIIPLPLKVSESIDCYVKKRDEKFGGSTEYLIVTNQGEKVYEKLVYRIVNIYLGDVTSSKKKSPHVLRHSYATELLNNGADLSAIKELLGHSSLAATQVYTHSSIEKIKEIYKSAHPRSVKN